MCIWVWIESIDCLVVRNGSGGRAEDVLRNQQTTVFDERV